MEPGKEAIGRGDFNQYQFFHKIAEVFHPFLGHVKAAPFICGQYLIKIAHYEGG